MCMPVLSMLYIYSSIPAELSVTIYHFIGRNFYGLGFKNCMLAISTNRMMKKWVYECVYNGLGRVLRYIFLNLK